MDEQYDDNSIESENFALKVTNEKYKVLGFSPIDKGGASAIYKVKEAGSTERKIIKMPLGKGNIEKLKNETEAVGIIGKHENILDQEVTSVKMGSTEMPAIISPEMDKSDRLDKRIESGDMDLKEIQKTAQDLASALDYISSKGMSHGDVSVKNFYKPQGERGRLTDFSNSSEIGKKPTVGQKVSTGEEATFGTPEYLSPERGLSEAPSPTSDLYSGALIVYEMFAGKQAYALDDYNNLEDVVKTKAKMNGFLSIDPRDSRTMNRGVTLRENFIKGVMEKGEKTRDEAERMAEVMDKALQRDPNQRYSSNKEFVDTLFK